MVQIVKKTEKTGFNIVHNLRDFSIFARFEQGRDYEILRSIQVVLNTILRDYHFRLCFHKRKHLYPQRANT
jgi:hypothetical protein